MSDFWKTYKWSPSCKLKGNAWFDSSHRLLIMLWRRNVFIPMLWSQSDFFLQLPKFSKINIKLLIVHSTLTLNQSRLFFTQFVKFATTNRAHLFDGEWEETFRHHPDHANEVHYIIHSFFYLWNCRWSLHDFFCFRQRISNVCLFLHVLAPLGAPLRSYLFLWNSLQIDDDVKCKHFHSA